MQLHIKHKMKTLVLALTLLIGSTHLLQAQQITPLKHLNIAIFAPLYLDSAFDGSYYKYGKAFPKFATAGLEFIHGAKIALDSIAIEGVAIHAFIFDSKAEIKNIPWLVENLKLDSMHLLIGSVKDVEVTQLASFAKQKNIPFISATAPNDGGITSNPFFIIVNGTLKAHCETMYSYLLQNNSGDNIYLVRKAGTQEDKIASYFKQLNEPDKNKLLQIKTLFIDSSFAEIEGKLDSTRKNIIIGASLNETFAAGLSKTLYPLKKTYPITLLGMPNWYGMSDLKKAALKDLEIQYTAPYYNAKADIYSKKIQAEYIRKFKTNPTEMSFKGFEAVFLFAKLLGKYPDDFTSHLNEITKQAFGEYNFKPVYVKKDAPLPDYFENKHLYLMKLVNGKSYRMWDK